MNTPSPFRNNRYELEGHHVYFLLDDDIKQLEQPKSSYIVGTRGTGKTTLLKALSWRERVENPSLRSQIGEDPGLDRYLGVYLKLPEFQLAQLEEWLADSPQRVHAAITSTYLDLVWLEAVLEAVTELRNRRFLSYSLEAEISWVEEFLEWFSSRTSSTRSVESEGSLIQLRDGVFSLRHWIEVAAIGGLAPVDVVATLPVDQVGALGRYAARGLRDLCRPAGPSGDEWNLRVCMDEGEVLSDRQQLVLNSMLRGSGFPLYFVVAFAAMPRDVSSTLQPNQMLSEADRHLEIRDDMDDEKFRRLAEGVASGRVRAMFGEPSARFDLDQLLGPLELDRWIASALKKSESEGKAKDLLDRAQALAVARGYDGSQAPPILELYLCEVEGRTPSDMPSRSEQSRGIRKKRTAAYLALCWRFGFEIRYASAVMVRQLSDGCIRDFLAQMEAIFMQCSQPLEEFLVRSRIPFSEQDRALKAASENKRRSLLRRIEVSPPEDVERIVDGLAKVTARLQRTMLPAEPGRFVLDIKEQDTEVKAELDVLREANQAGYLRALAEDQERFVFRVHTSLAPAYGFSYRGAYYDVPLSVAELKRLRNAPSDHAAASVVNSIVGRFSPPASATLFERFEHEE